MNGGQTTTAYVMGIAISLIFLIIAALISNSIKFEGGSNPKDPRKRKMWFWTLAGFMPALNFLLGFLLIRPGIKNPMFQQQYNSALGISTILAVVIYILLGFILSKVFKNGKLGNWF